MHLQNQSKIMTTTFTIAGNNISMSKTWDGFRMFFNETRPTWRIRIQINGEKPFTFAYHDSPANWQREWDKADYLESLICALQDALSYCEYPYKGDFCQEFGYTNMSAGNKAYLGCKRIYEQFNTRYCDEDVLRQMFDYIENTPEERLLK